LEEIGDLKLSKNLDGKWGAVIEEEE